MNFIFVLLVAGGIVFALLTGNAKVVTTAVASSAGSAVERIFGLIGILAFWLGMAKIAETSGLLKSFAALLQPLVGRLFPGVPKGHPAMGAILMNMSANMLGMGSAATPFGLKAMGELQKLNSRKDTASDAMCTFLAINTAGLTLVPATIIAVRASFGSGNAAEIVGPTIFATFCSTLVAVVTDNLMRRRYSRRIR